MCCVLQGQGQIQCQIRKNGEKCFWLSIIYLLYQWPHFKWNNVLFIQVILYATALIIFPQNSNLSCYLFKMSSMTFFSKYLNTCMILFTYLTIFIGNMVTYLPKHKFYIFFNIFLPYFWYNQCQNSASITKNGNNWNGY